MSGFIGDWHALLILVVAGFLPNEVWRMVGLWFGGGVDEGSKVVVLVAPVDGPDGRRINPLYYRLGNATNAHNPSSYDLWAVIKTRSGQPKIIGNWKD